MPTADTRRTARAKTRKQPKSGAKPTPQTQAGVNPATRPSPPRGRRRADTGPTRLAGARTRMYHDLVFESAECVFGAKGFEHTTMQDVAREAGISLKTLYATYPGKRELYNEIQQVRGRAFVETVLEASVEGADTVLRLECAVRAYVEFLSDHRDWLRIHLQTRTSWGLRPLVEYAADYWQRGLDHFAGIVRAGMKERVFYEGDAGEAAALVLAIMQVRVAQIAEEPETDRDAAVRDIMLHLQRLLCR